MNLQFGARLIPSPDAKLFNGPLGRKAQADVTAVMTQLNTAGVSDDVVVWVNREATGQGEYTYGLNAALADSAMNQTPQSVFDIANPPVFAPQVYDSFIGGKPDFGFPDERQAEVDAFVTAVKELDAGR